jgi:hypothetical protein
MTIHLDWDEAEFWQQYESVNESVIATVHAAVRHGGLFKPFRLIARTDRSRVAAVSDM